LQQLIGFRGALLGAERRRRHVQPLDVRRRDAFQLRGAEAARELLADIRTGEPEVAAPAGGERPLRLAAGLLIALAGAAALIWVLYQLAS
jgi:hypothetical protein